MVPSPQRDIIIIPDYLKQYADQIKAGLASVANRRREVEFNRPRAERGRPVQLPEIPPLPPIPQSNKNWPERIKVWPEIIITATFEKHGGAARLLFLARALDGQGSGHVTKIQLLDYLKWLGVPLRTVQRWTKDALETGIIKQYRDVYYLAGLASVAEIFKAKRIGQPAGLQASVLVDAGWRSYNWAGYLTSHHERPISQETKGTITGVDPRTQRRYQRSTGEAYRNFTVLHKAKPDHVEGLREVGIKAFTGRGQVFRRLPDARIVYPNVSQSLPKGRSRKAQKQLNQVSSKVGRETLRCFRLFNLTQKECKATQRKLSHDDTPPWEKPAEIFIADYRGKHSTRWECVSLASGSK